MSIDHILASITSTPLMITPDKLSIIMEVLGNRQQISLDLGKLAGLVPEPSAAAPAARPANQTGATQIAVISVVGSLLPTISPVPGPKSFLRMNLQGLPRQKRFLMLQHSHQFSWDSDKKPDDIEDHAAFVECLEAAFVAMDQRLQGSTFHGADHYHAVSVDPLWNRHMKKVAEIGDHIFYRA